MVKQQEEEAEEAENEEKQTLHAQIRRFEM
jgi:hypothetical protein